MFFPEGRVRVFVHGRAVEPITLDDQCAGSAFGPL
jgi:hypothetical protein